MTETEKQAAAAICEAVSSFNTRNAIDVMTVAIAAYARTRGATGKQQIEIYDMAMDKLLEQRKAVVEHFDTTGG
jgi:hypothetical protein